MKNMNAEMKNMNTENYIVRYYIEDDVVARKHYSSKQEALDAVVELDCDAFEDTEDCSLLAEAVRESDDKVILWANSEGDRGTDVDDIDPWDI